MIIYASSFSSAVMPFDFETVQQGRFPEPVR
jgi:hypothetical protein